MMIAMNGASQYHFCVLKSKTHVVMLPCPLDGPSGSTLVFVADRLKPQISVSLNYVSRGTIEMRVCDFKSILCLIMRCS